MAAYERAFALWPQPCDEFDLGTATATTRVHAYRPHPGGDPVVLLTGSASPTAAGSRPTRRSARPGGSPRSPCSTLPGLTKLGARFWWWFSISGLATLTPMPLRRRLARWLDNPAMLDRELITLMWAGIRGYRIEPKKPGILTDDELRAITVPVLLVTGARSALITPAQARARASLMPHAEVAVVPGSHGSFNRISELNDRIAAFIKAHATGKQAD
jgi:pimeloyl-ACP methyl ester carboxylesterase